tara:strand:+ start:1005 stop:1961 length:957 start_codon:yes stop_codon:yes gene_type:complete
MDIIAPDSGDNSPAFHRPVLLAETVEQLAVRPGGVYLDATFGEGGHAEAILDASAPSGSVLGIDLDPRSLAGGAERLEGYGRRLISVQGNYADMVALAQAKGVTRVDGVLLDLGFSSRQIQEPGYGLSFRTDEPLDMRYDPAGPLTADRIVNTYPEKELARLIFQYGEEPRSRAIARDIVRGRPIRSTLHLAGLVARTVGQRRGRRVHPATRTFQALRMAVNGELDNLEGGLMAAVQLLAPAGRLVVISYHSLEDRAVKGVLARESASCTCPPELPICACGSQPVMRIVNRKVIRPSFAEVQSNPRSRSAKMRVAQRI